MKKNIVDDENIYDKFMTIWENKKNGLIRTGTNIPYPLIRTRTCAYQGVRNISNSKKFVYVLNDP